MGGTLGRHGAGPPSTPAASQGREDATADTAEGCLDCCCEWLRLGFHQTHLERVPEVGWLGSHKCAPQGIMMPMYNKPQGALTLTAEPLGE